MNHVPPPPPILITVASVAFGAIVGSFLNVCIYRLPRGLSVHSPARSYCPHCRRTIPWWENVPILSWIILKGRCSACHAAIHVRYVLVEIVTAFLFGSSAAFLPLASALLLLPMFTLLGILVVATCVDLEHLLIPNEITWGGVCAGVLFSLFLPALHHASSPLSGLGLSLFGAATGYSVLWGVVELGRFAFGKKRLLFKTPSQVHWVRSGEQADLTVGVEITHWGDYFVRGSEEIRMGVCTLDIDGETIQGSEVQWTLNQIQILPSEKAERKVMDLNLIGRISLQAQWITLPREVMGFGDVKFLAAIGAFLGSEATIFTLAASSCFGACYFFVTLAMGRRQWSPIPFGPYLAAGATAWIVAGPDIVHAYMHLLSSGR